MNLAKYALDNTKIIYFFLAVLLVGGILSFDRLGKKEDDPLRYQVSGHYDPLPGSRTSRSRTTDHRTDLPRDTVDEWCI